MALANIFQCKPVHAGWNFFAPGHCASLQDIAVATGALNIVSDVAIVLLPVPMVQGLHIQLPKVIGLLIVFSTGVMYIGRYGH